MMEYLVDTHALLWWDVEPERIGPAAMKIFQDPGNTLFVSHASVWELAIKLRLKKLTYKHFFRRIDILQGRSKTIEYLTLSNRIINGSPGIPLGPRNQGRNSKALIHQGQQAIYFLMCIVS